MICSKWRSVLFFDGLITDVTRFFEWVTNNKDCFIYQYHILHVMLKQKGGSHHLSLEIRIRARQIVAWYGAEDYRSEDTVCDDEHFLLESSDFEFCNLYIQICLIINSKSGQPKWPMTHNIKLYDLSKMKNHNYL